MTAAEDPRFTDRETWLAARKALLAREKAFTRERDALSAARRVLPAVRIDKPYRFETERGEATLADLFKGCGQLIVYHFMFVPAWEEGCKSCSFWADNFNGIDVHLAARDTALTLVSTAPLATLLRYRRRMGWSLDWASSGGSDFNQDFGVTFQDRNPGPSGGYNYSDAVPFKEMPGVSVFRRYEDGAIAHSYSTYARGLDILNTAYTLLDLTPKGRDENKAEGTMAWLRRRDEYRLLTE